MALSIAFDGNLTLQLTPEARAQPIPVAFNGTYTRKALHDVVIDGAVTNQAVAQGSVTNPKYILIWVRQGTISFSWASNGAGGLEVSANPTPPPDDSPLLILMRYSPNAAQLYMTTTGPARGAVWVLS